MKPVVAPLVVVVASFVAPLAPAQDRLWTAIGDHDPDHFGDAVRVVGDSNGDGHRDVCAGTYLKYRRVLDGTNGAKLFDVRSACEQFGPWDSADFDGDGTEDLLVMRWCSGSSKTAILSGATGSKLYEIAGSGELAIDDQDGDGIADFVALYLDPVTWLAEVHIHSGRDGALLRTIAPAGRSGGFGFWGIVPAGDWNLDGTQDLAISDSPAPAGLGSILIVSLADGSILATSPVDYTFYSQRNHALESLGDVDGDGIFDYLVTNSVETVAGRYVAGAVRIVSGAKLRKIEKFAGTRPLEGLDVAGVCGDVDGDGVSDFVLTPYGDSSQFSTTAWLYSGATRRRLYAIQSAEPQDAYFEVTSGDVDGDGLAEIVSGHIGYGNTRYGGRGLVVVDRGRRSFLSVVPSFRSVYDAIGPAKTMRDQSFEFFAAGFQPGSPASLDLVEYDAASTSTNLAVGTIDAFGEWTTRAVLDLGDFLPHTYGVQLTARDRSGNLVTTAIERCAYR
jgi:hypothetical protein